MVTTSLTTFDYAQWGQVLLGVQEDGDRRVPNTGALVVSGKTFKVKIIPDAEKEMTYELTQIVEISNTILMTLLEESEPAVIMSRGLKHLLSSVRVGTEKYGFHEKGAYAALMNFCTQTEDVITKLDKRVQSLRILEVAYEKALTAEHIAIVRVIINHDYTLLFDLTSYEESFFDVTDENCPKEVILPLLSDAVRNIAQLNSRQINKLKAFLFHYRAPKLTLFEMLMQRKDANELFDALLKFITQDELNGEDIKRNLIFDFAHSDIRYEYIFLKVEDLSPEVIRAADDCYRRAKMTFKTTIHAEYATKNLTKYRAWLAKRSESSTTVADRGGTTVATERWMRAELIRSAASCRDRGDISRFKWSFVKEMHTALCTGEEGVINPGKLRTGIVRTSGGWSHLYCPPAYLKDKVMKLIDWMSAGLAQCEAGRLNPIIFAYQVNQRLVSFHSFENANGRISRLDMDYVLERFHLPPPILGKDILDGVFPMDSMRSDREGSIRKMIAGIELSRRELLDI